MPAKRNKAAGKDKSVVTYSGADRSLWDDGELLRLCAAQLEKGEGEVGHLTPPSTPSSNASSSEADAYANTPEASKEESSSNSSSSSDKTVSSDSSQQLKRKRGRCNAIGPMTSHLPKNVRALVESFYMAGYEAASTLSMKGNRLARGGDPMKTRSERRKERTARISKTNRAQRLRKRLARFRAKDFAHQQDGHTTALMESYILRRKAERAEEKKQEAAKAAAAAKNGEAPPDSSVEKDGKKANNKHQQKKQAAAPAKGGPKGAHVAGAKRADAKKQKPRTAPQKLPLSSKKITPRSLY